MAFAFPLLSRSAGFLLRSGHRRTVPVKARPALFFGAAGAAAALAPANPSAGMQCPPLKGAGIALPPKGRRLAEACHPFPARRSALCAGPKDAAPVAPAGLSAGYFDYKIAFFFVKKVFACCGPGIVGLQYILDRGGEKKEEGFAQIGYGRFVRKQRPKGSANPSWQL